MLYCEERSGFLPDIILLLVTVDPMLVILTLVNLI